MTKEEWLEEIDKKRKEWEETTVTKVISRFPEIRERFETLSGIECPRTTDPAFISQNDYLKDLSFPGQFPFTRGVQPTMYRGRYWTMRQYAGFGTADETNRRYKYLLDAGQTGLSVAFDLPTQIGLDNDNAMAEGEVGKVGVSISSLEDMRRLFDGIPLDKVSTSMTINSPAAVLLAMYIVVAEEQGISRNKLRGTIQNDLLKEYVARGTYIFPPRPSMKIITDIFEFCSSEMPFWNTISISGYHIREAGSTAVQEVAFTLGNGIEYVKAAIEAGLDVDSFAPRLSFFFNAHNDFFEEIAKFRAARRLWARIMKEKFQAKDPKSMQLRFHTQTAGCTLTAQQPDNNIMRVTLQALAAVLGGTQSLHTNSRDEALALPNEDSVTIALRTQQIIANESGVGSSIDPIGGSYFVEYLTDQIEREAEEYIAKIEEIGGMIPAIEQGYIQQEIQESAYIYQRRVETNDLIVIGVNRFQEEEIKKKELKLLKVDMSVGKTQIERLKGLRTSRDENVTKEKLASLQNIAEEGGNIMYPIIEAVRAYATLGEICDVLRQIYGEYKAAEII